MDFTAQSVVTSFIQNEKVLGEVLNIVPYCQEHLDVWSPALVTVLLESCSQLESLWKYQLIPLAQYVKDKPTITDYFNYFGRNVVPSWVVFWGEKPTRIIPFDTWEDVEKKRRCDKYKPLDWWKAYNKLKHDRFVNQDQATLQRTVRAVGALLISIIKAEFCRKAILQANWVFGNTYDPQTPFSKVFNFDYVAIETNLFSYAVGWEKESNLSERIWKGPASYRFRLWFDEQYHAE